MTVDPGFGGQDFIAAVASWLLDRTAAAVQKTEAQTVEADDTLQVDGETAEKLFQAPACRDRFGDIQQRLEARHRRIPSGRASTFIRHEEVVHVVRRLGAPAGWPRTGY